MRAHEVNTHVASRKLFVGRVEGNLPTSPSATAPSTRDLLAWLDDFLDSMGAGIKHPHSEEAAIKMVDVLARIRSWNALLELPQLRPGRAFANALASVVTELSKLWPLYARALTASDPGMAQQLATTGQAILDGAGAPIASLMADEEALQFFGDSELDLFEQLAVVLARFSPAENLISMDERARAELGALLGISDIPTGFGVEFELHNLVASVYLDAARFRTAVRLSVDIFSDADKLKNIAAEPGSMQSLTDAARAQNEALRAFQRLAIPGETESFLVRQLLRLHADNMEQGLLPLLSWALLSTGMKAQPFSKLLTADSTDLASRFLSHRHGRYLLEGADAYLRHAASHGHSYELQDGSVVFRLRGYQETLPVQELEDKVLALLESNLAMSFALRLQLTRAGEALDDASLLRESGVTDFRIASLAVEANVNEVLAASEYDNLWSFTVSSAVSSFTLAVAIAQHAPKGMGIRVEQHGIPGSISVGHADMQKYYGLAAEASAIDRAIALLALLSSVQDESGHPIHTEPQAQFVLGCVSLPLLRQGELAQTRNLRLLRTIAINSNFMVTVGDIDEVFRSLRSPEIQPRDLLARLTSYVSYNAPAVPEAGAVEVRWP